MSRPTILPPSFDFLELRSYRRESILQYSLTYRTEQLRILFFGSALVGLFFPYINGGSSKRRAAL